MKQLLLIPALIILSLSAFGQGNARYPAKTAPAKEVKQEEKVYICLSSSAYAYHSDECRGLERCTHKVEHVTITAAKNKGYRPCKICY